MGKDRSKSGAIKWSTNFYLEKSSRGHVVAGIRGAPIRVCILMDDAVRKRSSETEDYDRTCQPDSIWAKEMERMAEVATTLVREAWNVWRDTGKSPVLP
jgi:hypothetical protein